MCKFDNLQAVVPFKQICSLCRYLLCTTFYSQVFIKIYHSKRGVYLKVIGRYTAVQVKFTINYCVLLLINKCLKSPVFCVGKFQVP